MRNFENIAFDGRKIKIDFLIVGHPRSGTGYMSKLFTSMGYQVGHETIGPHGTSCWTFATDSANYLFGAPGPGERGIKNTTRKNLDYKYLIHCIRNPFDTINSVYQTENNGNSDKFRMIHAKPKIVYKNDLEKTILSVIRWNEMIEKIGPVAVFKVEDCENQVFNFLTQSGYKPIKKESVSKNYNTREKSSSNKLSVLDYKNVSKEVLDELDAYCTKYGYKNILNA